jgi:hypothetical protein
MKQLFLSLLLLFSISGNAQNKISTDLEDIELFDAEFEGKNVCQILFETIYKEYDIRDHKMPEKGYFSNHGALLYADYQDFAAQYDKQGFISKHKNLRDKNNNVIVSKVYKKKLLDQGIRIGSVITKIDKKLVSSLSDDEITKIFYNNDNEIEVEFFDNRKDELKTIKVKKENYFVTFLELDIDEKFIRNIDSKKSEHTANINLEIFYTLKPKIHWFMDEIYSKFTKISKKYPFLSTNQSGFACSISEDELKELGLFNPKIRFLNQMSNLAEANLKETIRLDYTYETGELIVLKKINLKNGVFKDNFQFQSFPFDAQNLEYKIKLINAGATGQTDVVFNPKYAPKNFLAEIMKSDINEWKHSHSSYENSIFQDGYNHQVVTFYHGIERNYTYYIFKIILPILIILFISWSVLWIRPKEIEARLTVSIVCLLSLIAYTFIIDKDIPKLSYLTIMDYVVLVSYFFSVLPTIQTIFVHNHINKKTNSAGLEYAKKIDNIAIKLIPTAYFLILFLIFNKVMTDNLNTIKSFTL